MAITLFIHKTQLRSSMSKSENLFFQTHRKTVKVSLKDIIYIESVKNYIVIHRKKHPELLLKLPLRKVESELPVDLFLRIHRSYIVSMRRVSAFSQYKVEMGALVLPIGRSYCYREISERLMQDTY